MYRIFSSVTYGWSCSDTLQSTPVGQLKNSSYLWISHLESDWILSVSTWELFTLIYYLPQKNILRLLSYFIWIVNKQHNKIVKAIISVIYRPIVAVNTSKCRISNGKTPKQGIFSHESLRWWVETIGAWSTMGYWWSYWTLQ